jgi:histone H3/H4
MKRITVFIPVVLVVFLVLVAPVSAVVAGKVTHAIIEATVESAAKQSGREFLGQTAKKSACETLERLVKTYGDDVIKVVDDAGFELLESVPKYGDEVVELSLKASPQGRRVFVQNIPELLPLGRRIGVEALELEAKSPGLSVQVFKVFGDDAGKILARNVPAEDIPRLLAYAEKADTPATRKLLVEAYEKEGKSLFERIPAKLVLAGGLTASMLYVVHQLTDPVRAIGDAIDKNSDVADTAVRHFFAWGVPALLVIVVLLFWRFGLMPWQRSRRQTAGTPISQPAPQKKEKNSEQEDGQGR